MARAQSVTCGDFLAGETYSVGEGESVKRASEIMEETNIGFLPVCDDGGDVVGTLTDRDIVTRVVARGIAAEAAVADVMTRGAVTCGTREKLHNVVDKLRADKLSRLVCLDENGGLAGVLPHQVAAAEQEVAVSRT